MQGENEMNLYMVHDPQILEILSSKLTPEPE